MRTRDCDQASPTFESRVVYKTSPSLRSQADKATPVPKTKANPLLVRTLLSVRSGRWTSSPGARFQYSKGLTIQKIWGSSVYTELPLVLYMLCFCIYIFKPIVFCTFDKVAWAIGATLLEPSFRILITIWSSISLIFNWIGSKNSITASAISVLNWP